MKTKFVKCICHWSISGHLFILVMSKGRLRKLLKCFLLELNARNEINLSCAREDDLQATHLIKTSPLHFTHFCWSSSLQVPRFLPSFASLLFISVLNPHVTLQEDLWELIRNPTTLSTLIPPFALPSS